MPTTSGAHPAHTAPTPPTIPELATEQLRPGGRGQGGCYPQTQTFQPPTDDDTPLPPGQPADTQPEETSHWYIREGETLEEAKARRARNKHEGRGEQRTRNREQKAQGARELKHARRAAAAAAREQSANAPPDQPTDWADLLNRHKQPRGTWGEPTQQQQQQHHQPPPSSLQGTGELHQHIEGACDTQEESDSTETHWSSSDEEEQDEAAAAEEQGNTAPNANTPQQPATAEGGQQPTQQQPPTHTGEPTPEGEDERWEWSLDGPPLLPITRETQIVFRQGQRGVCIWEFDVLPGSQTIPGGQRVWQRGVSTPQGKDQPPPIPVGVRGQLRKVRGEDVWVMAVVAAPAREEGGDKHRQTVQLQQGQLASGPAHLQSSPGHTAPTSQPAQLPSWWVHGVGALSAAEPTANTAAAAAAATTTTTTAEPRGADPKAYKTRSPQQQRKQASQRNQKRQRWSRKPEAGAGGGADTEAAAPTRAKEGGRSPAQANQPSARKGGDSKGAATTAATYVQAARQILQEQAGQGAGAGEEVAEGDWDESIHHLEAALQCLGEAGREDEEGGPQDRESASHHHSPMSPPPGPGGGDLTETHCQGRRGMAAAAALPGLRYHATTCPSPPSQSGGGIARHRGHAARRDGPTSTHTRRAEHSGRGRWRA